MGKKDNNNPRCRNFALLLYPDNKDYEKQLQKVLMVDAAYILHDKDTIFDDDDGDLKKAHVHVLVRYNNPRYLLPTAEYFGIDSRFIRPKEDYAQFARYLVHLYNPDKYHYPINDIKGNDAERVKQIIIDSETTNDEKLAILIQWIENRTLFINYRTFIKYAASQNLSGFVMGKWYFWRSVIDQFNDQFKTIIRDCGTQDEE